MSFPIEEKRAIAYRDERINALKSQVEALIGRIDAYNTQVKHLEDIAKRAGAAVLACDRCKWITEKEYLNRCRVCGKHCCDDCRCLCAI